MSNDAPITNAQLAATLRGWADTLSPTTPPVAVPELAGWRAKCKIDERNPGDWRVIWDTPRDGALWLRTRGGWELCVLLNPSVDAGFPTRAAAAAALNAASPPPGVVGDKARQFTAADYESCPHCCGSFSFNRPREDGACPFCKKTVVEPKPAPTTGTVNTRPYAAVVADGKAVPAFDAEKWADAVIRSVNVTVTVIGNRCSADIPAGAKAAVVGLVNAIYAAGAASVKPNKEAASLGLGYKVELRNGVTLALFYSLVDAQLFVDRCRGVFQSMRIVDTQPAAPTEAKESAQ